MSKIYSVYNIMQRNAIFSNLENIQMICSWKLFLNIQYQYKTCVPAIGIHTLPLYTWFIFNLHFEI